MGKWIRIFGFLFCHDKTSVISIEQTSWKFSSLRRATRNSYPTHVAPSVTFPFPKVNFFNEQKRTTAKTKNYCSWQLKPGFWNSTIVVSCPQFGGRSAWFQPMGNKREWHVGCHAKRRRWCFFSGRCFLPCEFQRNVNIFLLRYDVNVAMWPFSCQLCLPHMGSQGCPNGFSPAFILMLHCRRYILRRCCET